MAQSDDNNGTDPASKTGAKAQLVALIGIMLAIPLVLIALFLLVAFLL